MKVLLLIMYLKYNIIFRLVKVIFDVFLTFISSVYVDQLFEAQNVHFVGSASLTSTSRIILLIL